MRPILSTTAPEEMKIVTVSDGTETVAEVIQKMHGSWYVLGHGTARRRKGDPRNRDLGQRLALARAFRAAAEQIEKDIKIIHGLEA